MKKRRLIYRLSSLGDVVIATAVLEPPYDGETHWVVAREFAPLLEGRMDLDRVIAFDRRSHGLVEWIRLNRELFKHGYDEVFDLHRTSRTWIARLLYRIEEIRGTVRKGTPWRRISKERGKRLAYMLFKRLWPESLRPLGVRTQVLGFAETPRDFDDTSPGSVSPGNAALTADTRRPLLGVAPSSAWPGKEWPVELFLQLLQRMQQDYDFVLLGTLHDQSAVELEQKAAEKGIAMESWLGKYSLADLGENLKRLDQVVSCDSGLAHLAESVGLPVVAVYGPTRSDFGFGLKNPQSEAVNTPLWCSPCSKDGSLCFRPFHRYKCMNMIDPSVVEAALRRGARKS